MSDFKFFILDDYSTDGSWEWLQQVVDNRIHLYWSERNRGLLYNLNFLIGKPRGTIIKLWSEDDVLHANCFSGLQAFHEKYAVIGFSYTGWTYVDAAGNDLNIHQQDDTAEIVSPILHARITFFTGGSITRNIANTAINKKVLDIVGPSNEKMKISADFKMWVRLAKDYRQC